jgi:hypothetical protein
MTGCAAPPSLPRVTAKIASPNPQWPLAFGSVTIGPAARVGGDVLVENIAVDVATERGVAAAVQIGWALLYACAGDKVGGDLVVDGNSAAALVFANQVTGALQAINNSGPLDVVGNTVGATLQCQSNTTLIISGNNTAAQKQGQCN